MRVHLKSCKQMQKTLKILKFNENFIMEIDEIKLTISFSVLSKQISLGDPMASANQWTHKDLLQTVHNAH